MNLVGQVIKSCEVQWASQKILTLTNQVHIPVNSFSEDFITYQTSSYPGEHCYIITYIYALERQIVQNV